jgi:transposase
MPSSKPTLGYSSRTEAAVALRAQGLSEPAIAEKIGVSRNAIAGLLAKAKDNRQAPQIGRGTSRGNADTLAAKAAGIMLSHEAARPIHRPTSDGAMRVIELKLPEAQFGKLVEMARKAARTPSAYATDLFQAAYSARCAPTGDAALDAAVTNMDAAGPIDGTDWEAEARSLNAQLQSAGRRLEHADAALTAARMEIAAHEACRQKLHDEVESLSARGLELEAALAEMKNGHDARSAAPFAPLPPAEPGALTAAQLRQAKALRAAGNSVGEIAASLGMTAALVRQSMGGK